MHRPNQCLGVWYYMYGNDSVGTLSVSILPEELYGNYYRPSGNLIWRTYINTTNSWSHATARLSASDSFKVKYKIYILYFLKKRGKFSKYKTKTERCRKLSCDLPYLYHEEHGHNFRSEHCLEKCLPIKKHSTESGYFGIILHTVCLPSLFQTVKLLLTDLYVINLLKMLSLFLSLFIYVCLYSGWSLSTEI